MLSIQAVQPHRAGRHGRSGWRMVGIVEWFRDEASEPVTRLRLVESYRN
jgi:hypothetical protein